MKPDYAEKAKPCYMNTDSSVVYMKNRRHLLRYCKAC